MAAAPNIAVSEESLFLVSDNSIKLISGMQNGWSSRQEAITITSSGSVGIGTSSPGQKLDVAGNIRTSGQLIALHRRHRHGSPCGQQHDDAHEPQRGSSR